MRPTLVLSVCLALAGSAVEARAQEPEDAAPAPGPVTTPDDSAESPELHALRLAEQQLFAAPSQALVELPAGGGALPAALTSDVPGGAEAPAQGEVRDLSYLRDLSLPDLPVRWDPRVVDFLHFFREDPRGHAIMAGLLRRMPRWETELRSALRAQHVPEDLVYVAMVESGFDPASHSSAGALGIWQFVAGTGDSYGLRRSHWVDERQSPTAASDAAARYLGDLYRRFGTWELALAAYNMGYGALLRAIRKYNTNDFWQLARIEAGLPFETTIYVAKIMACAIVGRNPARFGFASLEREPAADTTEVEVPGGTPLGLVARAAGIDVAALSALNPALRRSRTPPDVPTWSVRIPRAASEAFARSFPRLRARAPREQAYVVRFGETLADVAQRFATQAGSLGRANDLADGEHVHAGDTLMVPAVTPHDVRPAEPPVVAVPDRRFVYPGRRQVFYRVIEGDTAQDVARFFAVSTDDLRRWNGVDPNATLQRGMFLQLFVGRDRDLSQALVLAPDDARVLVVGSPEFFDWHEGQAGRVRISYTVRDGDTLDTVAARFGLSVGSLARINRTDRAAALVPDRTLIVYVPRGDAERIEADLAREARHEDAAAPDAPDAATAPASGPGPATAPASAPSPDAVPASASAPDAPPDTAAPPSSRVSLPPAPAP